MQLKALCMHYCNTGNLNMTNLTMLLCYICNKNEMVREHLLQKWATDPSMRTALPKLFEVLSSPQPHVPYQYVAKRPRTGAQSIMTID